MNISNIALFFIMTISLAACGGGGGGGGGGQPPAADTKSFTVNVGSVSISQASTGAEITADVSSANSGDLTYTF